MKILKIFLAVSAISSGRTFGSNCWEIAGKRYHIDPLLLYVIAEKESNFEPDAINKNKNNSQDIGIMQINSQWFPKLHQFGITEKDLYNPCLNIIVGAWILSTAIDVYGDSWEAVGAYNAGTKDNKIQRQKRMDYAADVYQRYHRYKLMPIK